MPQNDKNKVRFTPVRTVESKMSENIDDGHLYFAVDTGKIYLDAQGKRITMGGNSGIFYGQKEIPEDIDTDKTDFIFTFDEIEGDQVPNQKDLIFNMPPDGRFYRVEKVDRENKIIDTLRLTVSGGGGGGGASQTIITIKDIDNSQTKYFTKDAVTKEVTFNVDSSIKENNFITRLQVTVRGEKQEPDFEPKELGNITVDLTPYWENMSTSVVNLIDISVTDNYGTTKTINYRINVIELKLNSSITDEILYTSTKEYTYFCTPIGGTTLRNRRIVYNIYDENWIEQPAAKPEDSLITNADEDKKILNFENLAHGIYIFTAQYMGETDNGLTIKSGMLSYKIINYTAEGTLLAVIQPPVEVEQYSVVEIKYMIGGSPTSTTGTSNIDVSIKGSKDSEAKETQLKDVKNNVVQTWRVYFDTVDTYDLTIGETILNTITVTPYDGIMPTIDENDESLMLLLKTTNRSNNDADKNIWQYKNAIAELKDFYWGNINGWMEDKETKETMLHMTSGANFQINNLYPFEKDAKTTGLTIEMDFKISGVLDFNKPLIQCLSYDADETVEDRKIIAGFQITGQESTMNSANYQVTGATIKESDDEKDQAYNTAIQGLTTKFTEGERIHLTWVIERYNSQSKTPPLVRTYLNGIMSGLTEYTGSGGTADKFQENPIDRALISIDSTYADIDIYNIRIYSKGLSPNVVLNNYIATSGVVDERVLKALDNDITYEDGKINPEKVFHEEYTLSIPYIKLVGGIKNNKDDKWFVQSTADRRLPYAKKDYRLMSFEFIDPSGKMPYIKENIKLENPSTGAVVTSLDDAEVGFKTKEGCLVYGQGTSSMEYPVKNLRVKFKKNTFTVYDGAYPVDLLCFKADYMESSSSHNTGTGNLVYNLYKALGNNYKTPAQKFYNASNWGYDIVTAIKGFPVIIFYSPDGKDFEYIGKYNLNLDKATHEPFGFVSYDDGTTSFGIATDEDGKPIYEEILYETEEDFDESILPPYILKDGKYEEAEDYDANQTYYNRKETIHCFEFLNNASKLDNFLKEDGDETFRDSFYKIIKSEGKDVPNWTTAFESRFPEDAVTDKYVESWFRVCNWVASFGPEVDETKLAQFKSEFTDYFNLDFTLFYYVLTHFLLMIDSRAKNMMMATWDDIHWYPIFYDMDTMLGLNNYGYNKFNYTAIDTEKNLYNAENSVLWKYFREVFEEEIAEMYNKLRGAGLDYKSVVNNYNNNQADAWNEALYNADIYYKYIRPFTEGYYTGDPDPDDPSKNYVEAGKRNYLYAAQGPRSMHRQWWLNNRFNFFDGMYLSDDYKEDYFEMRLYTPSSEDGFVVDTSVTAETYVPGVSHYIYNEETKTYEISMEAFNAEKTYFIIDKGIAGSANVVPPCNDFTLTPLYDQYLSVGYGKGSNGQTVGPVFAKANTSKTLKASQASFIDTETYIYGGSFLKDLGDLSPQYMGKFNFPKSGQTKLERLIIGNPHNDYYNPNFSSLDIGSSAPYLQELNIMNCRGLANRPIDISKCGRIKTVLATGSGITSLAVPEYGILEELRLPKTIGTLSLVNHLNLRDEKFTIGECNYNPITKEYNYTNNFAGIRSLQVENTPINSYQIIMDSERLIYVSLKGFEWTITSNSLNEMVLEQIDVLEKLKDKRAFDGVSTLAASVSGNIHIAIEGAKVNAIDIYNKYWNVFPNVTFTYDADVLKEFTPTNKITLLSGSDDIFWTKEIQSGASPDDAFFKTGPNGSLYKDDGTMKVPTKPSTQSHTYDFSGEWLDKDTNLSWTIEGLKTIAIEKDYILTPIFNENIKMFNIEFYNDENIVLTDELAYGTKLTTPSIIINKDDTGLSLEKTYSHKGWTDNPNMTLVKNEYELNQALRVLENYTASRDMKFYAVYMEVNVKDNVLADKYLQFIEDEKHTGYYIKCADGYQLIGKITLPATHNGLPILGLYKGLSGAFNNQNGITHIFWEPGAVASVIEDSSFNLCSNLEYFEFLPTITTIGNRAFFNCNLKNLDLSWNGLVTLGDMAFSWAFDESVPKSTLYLSSTLQSIGKQCFTRWEIVYSTVEIGSLNNPSQLSNIANDAFDTTSSTNSKIYVYTEDINKEIWTQLPQDLTHFIDVNGQ